MDKWKRRGSEQEADPDKEQLAPPTRPAFHLESTPAAVRKAPARRLAATTHKEKQWEYGMENTEVAIESPLNSWRSIFANGCGHPRRAQCRIDGRSDN